MGSLAEWEETQSHKLVRGNEKGKRGKKKIIRKSIQPNKQAKRK